MNDCHYEKKDWRACRAEVSVEPQPRCLFAVPTFSTLLGGILADWHR